MMRPSCRQMVWASARGTRPGPPVRDQLHEPADDAGAVLVRPSQDPARRGIGGGLRADPSNQTLGGLLERQERRLPEGVQLAAEPLQSVAVHLVQAPSSVDPTPDQSGVPKDLEVLAGRRLAHPDPLGKLAATMRRARDIILGADGRVTESIKSKTPTFAYQGNIASFNPSKRLLSIRFHRGADLEAVIRAWCDWKAESSRSG
jgi:hypothetical protein